MTEDLSAEMWVHSNRAGVQFLARIVFPKIRNPKQLDEPLTRVVELDAYKAPAGGWQKLILEAPGRSAASAEAGPAARLKGDPDITDAYIDRLILNLYTGPGEVEVFVDNLEIGPVSRRSATASWPPKKVRPARSGQEKGPPVAPISGIAVEFNAATHDRRRAGLSAVRPLSGTPMQALKEAGFNGTLHAD